MSQVNPTFVRKKSRGQEKQIPRTKRGAVGLFRLYIGFSIILLSSLSWSNGGNVNNPEWTDSSGEYHYEATPQPTQGEWQGPIAPEGATTPPVGDGEWQGPLPPGGQFEGEAQLQQALRQCRASHDDAEVQCDGQRNTQVQTKKREIQNLIASLTQSQGSQHPKQDRDEYLKSCEHLQKVLNEAQSGTEEFKQTCRSVQVSCLDSCDESAHLLGLKHHWCRSTGGMDCSGIQSQLSSIENKQSSCQQKEVQIHQAEDQIQELAGSDRVTKMCQDQARNAFADWVGQCGQNASSPDCKSFHISSCPKSPDPYTCFCRQEKNRNADICGPGGIAMNESPSKRNQMEPLGQGSSLGRDSGRFANSSAKDKASSLTQRNRGHDKNGRKKSRFSRISNHSFSANRSQLNQAEKKRVASLYRNSSSQRSFKRRTQDPVSNHLTLNQFNGAGDHSSDIGNRSGSQLGSSSRNKTSQSVGGKAASYKKSKVAMTNLNHKQEKGSSSWRNPSSIHSPYYRTNEKGDSRYSGIGFHKANAGCGGDTVKEPALFKCVGRHFKSRYELWKEYCRIDAEEEKSHGEGKALKYMKMEEKERYDYKDCPNITVEM